MKKYFSPFGMVIDIAYAAVVLWILIYQTSNVFANLEASFIWAYPMAASHILMHRKINKTINTENINDN
jgi:hypothetical protein